MSFNFAPPPPDPAPAAAASRPYSAITAFPVVKPPPGPRSRPPLDADFTAFEVHPDTPRSDSFDDAPAFLDRGDIGLDCPSEPMAPIGLRISADGCVLPLRDMSHLSHVVYPAVPGPWDSVSSG